jgi:hypothetical protein
MNERARYLQHLGEVRAAIAPRIDACPGGEGLVASYDLAFRANEGGQNAVVTDRVAGIAPKPARDEQFGVGTLGPWEAPQEKITSNADAFDFDRTPAVQCGHGRYTPGTVAAGHGSRQVE